MIVVSDIEASVLTRWAAAGLIGSAPGDLKVGRRATMQPGNQNTGTLQQPYGVLEVKPTGQPQFYTEGGAAPNSPYTEKFTALVTLYGIGQAVMGSLLKATATGLADTGWTVAGGTVSAVWFNENRIEEDPATKQGEDWWRASITMEIQVAGNV